MIDEEGYQNINCLPSRKIFQTLCTRIKIVQSHLVQHMKQRWLSVVEQEEEPHYLKGGKHDPQNEKVEEHAQKIPTQGTKLIANNIGE